MKKEIILVGLEYQNYLKKMKKKTFCSELRILSILNLCIFYENEINSFLMSQHATIGTKLK